jgi:hypothetical protein
MNVPPIWDLKRKPFFDGYIVDAIPFVGRNRTPQYYLRHKATGKKYAVWGYWQLVKALQHRPVGDHIKIRFLGRKKMAGKSFSTFDFKINVGCDTRKKITKQRPRTVTAAAHDSHLRKRK